MTASVNPRLKIEGLVRTLYDARNRLSRDVSKELLTHFGTQVYRTVVPRNVKLAEAPSHGQAVLQYARGSAGSAAYQVLASELMGREKTTRITAEVA